MKYMVLGLTFLSSVCANNNFFQFLQQFQTMQSLVNSGGFGVRPGAGGGGLSINMVGSVAGITPGMGGAVAAAGLNCSCGYTNRERIIGGRVVDRNRYPMMGGIRTRRSSTVFCGAAMLTTSHALTAAHCTLETRESLLLLLGGHNLNEINSDGVSELIPISYINHERYSGTTFLNDISLLILERPVTFTSNIGPVCLPTSRLQLEGQYTKILGWGLTSHQGRTSTVLQEVDIRVIGLGRCNRFYSNALPTNPPTQFCTYEANKDSCQGDSGGPLIWLDPETNRYTLAGVVSYGRECASQVPAVNTDVSAFVPWIQARISDTNRNVRTCAKV